MHMTMSRASRYIEYAEECERLARKTPVRRAALRSLAQAWRDAADRWRRNQFRRRGE